MARRNPLAHLYAVYLHCIQQDVEGRMSSRSVAGVVAGVVAAVWVVLYPPLMWRLMQLADGVNDVE